MLNWRSGNAIAVPGKAGYGDNNYELHLDVQPGGHYAATVDDGESVTFQFKQCAETACQYICNGVQAKADYVFEDGRLWLAIDGKT